MDALQTKVESILFVASQALDIKKIARILEVRIEEVQEAIQELKKKYNVPESGVRIADNGIDFQMLSNPACSEQVERFKKRECSGELTPAQLETATVIAYREPITRAGIEQIRGVNCAVIIRNLLQRGLIEEKEDPRELFPQYYISIDAMRALGISSPADLPDYDFLSKHENIRPLVETEKENE
ncbi:MAG: SMC-Scp complex subunit ScpB [Candidatus Magasanikbacteria bacterium]|nr:SMC-Scp complex subunit ScpB [Candidatus Magasanikbacteria bacterium]